MSFTTLAPKTFCGIKHRLNTRTALTDQFEHIDNPAFKTIALYPHQSVVVAAMINVEDKRVITVDGDIHYNKHIRSTTDEKVIIETNALVLSEPFGSGKTIEILALILMRPVPKAFPMHLNAITTKFQYGHIYNDETFKTDIMRRYVGKDALIRPNLIIVGSSVLFQWEDQITKFTSLRYFIISDVFSLKKFLALYNARQLHNYDIILLKNGTVTGNFLLPGETIAKSTRGLITTIAKITEFNCWSRVIYDDFDTINIPTSTPVVNALFSVYVSATTNYSREKNVVCNYLTIADAMMQSSLKLNTICNDNMLFYNFNIVNDPEFTERSTQVTFINKFKYVFKNPNDNYMRLMGVMGDEAREIMEALNAGALGEACTKLGIGATSVADIFQKMLDTKYTKYIYDKDVIAVLCDTKKLIGDLSEHPKQKNPSNERLAEYEATIRKKHVPKIKYYHQYVAELLDQLYSEFTSKLEEDGRAINRVIENARDGDCQICCLPLEDSDAAIIVRCCGLIVCDMCGIKGNQISVKYNDKSKSHELYGNCANCKAHINPKEDLVYLDKSMDLNKILASRGDERPDEVTTETVVVVEEPEVVPEEITKKVDPKLKCLLDIINGTPIAEKQDHIIEIPHLMRGCVDIPPTEATECKMLIFANYNESLTNIQAYLRENNVEFMRLEGTAREKATTVAAFRISAKVLLINSQQNCAGLNLEFCSDIVFFHKLINGSIEAQVVGRGQRILRKSNLQLHYLLFDNEEGI